MVVGQLPFPCILTGRDPCIRPSVIPPSRGQSDIAGERPCSLPVRATRITRDAPPHLVCGVTGRFSDQLDRDAEASGHAKEHMIRFSHSLHHRWEVGKSGPVSGRFIVVDFVQARGQILSSTRHARTKR